MEKAGCVLCGGKVEGSVESVALTICCKNCCTKPKTTYSRVYKGWFRISKTRATSVFHCTEADLAILKFISLPNPVSPRGPRMKLYLRVEAEYLGKQRHQMHLVEKAKRDCGAIIGKKIALDSHFKMNITNMDRVLRHFLLGDFLKKASATTTTWNDISARYKVIHPVTEILEACDGAHPLAAFEFCQEHPDAGPVEFQDFKEKMKAVFRLEGARILYHLPVTERHLLSGTVLSDVYQEFSCRDSRAIVRGHLLKWFSEQTADEILNHPAVSRRLENMEEELSVAQKLKQFWEEKDDKAKRTAKLKKALHAKGLALPTDCLFSDEYVNGQIDCDLLEVVGIVEVYGILKKKGIRVRCSRSTFVENKFRNCLHKMKMGYEASVEEATKEDHLVFGSFLSDEDDDDDSLFLEDSMDDEYFFIDGFNDDYSDYGPPGFLPFLSDDDSDFYMY